MTSQKSKKELTFDDEALGDLLVDALGMDLGLPREESCPDEMEIFDYVNGDINEEITKLEIHDHIESCRICRSLFLRMEAEKALDEWQIRKKSSLWKKYQDKVQSALDAFQATREAVFEWLTDRESEILPGDLVPLYRGATCSATESEPLKFTYTLGDPPPVYPLATPASGFGKARYHSLIMLRPHRKDIVNLYENRPIGRSLQITPEFEEEDLGANELYLILSSEPLSIDDDEIELAPDLFIDALAEAGDEGAVIIKIEMKVLRRKVTFAQVMSEFKERLILSISPAWRPLWAGESVTASDIPEQSESFRMQEGEVDVSCYWRPRSGDRQAYLQVSWRVNIFVAAEIWALFIDPETEAVLSEVRLGAQFEGRKAFTADDLCFDPSTDKWAISILLKEKK